MVSHDPDEYVFDQACLFRVYVPVDRLSELEIYCVSELLFSTDYLETVRTGITQEKSVFEIYGVF